MGSTGNQIHIPTIDYKCSSPLGVFPEGEAGEIDVDENIRELHKRCPECRKEIEKWNALPER